MRKNIAIVLAAGTSSRMHSFLPKQFMDLCGRPVVAWSLITFQEFSGVDDIILVAPKEKIDYCWRNIVEKYRISKVKKIIAGGTQRCLSVKAGLDEIDNCKYVFIHDGARPLIDSAMLLRLLECVEKNGACVAGMPVKDTIKITDEEGYVVKTPERSLVWLAQTPQVFSFELIRDSYGKIMAEGNISVTDDSMVVEQNNAGRVKLAEGSYKNIKITTPEDLKIAELFLRERLEMR